MRFWDSSAIAAIALQEPSSDRIDPLLLDDPGVAAWWATPVECASAIGRRERSGELDAASAQLAASRLEELSERWTEISPSERVRNVAFRLVRVHDLRAADAFQIAAATEASEDGGRLLPVVTLDTRLALAARREGFPVLP